jgi:16S rRNA (uracil1498-N3)-methyltransferase
VSRARFFLVSALPDGDLVELPLSDGELRHAVGALRVAPGEEIEVVEPGGGVWAMCVERAAKTRVTARRLERLPDVPTSRLTLFQGVAKGEKMDAIVRQAVEIGVGGVVPVLTSRTVVKLDARKREQRGERWRRIAASAAGQAHRSAIPHVSDPVGFADALGSLGAFDCAVVLWEDHSGPGVAEALAAHAENPTARIALVVGPEGGLSAAEVDALVAAGATPASLGPTILRTETAAVVAVALAEHALGGLGAPRD